MSAAALGLLALLAAAGPAKSQAVDTTAALRTLTWFAETCEEQGQAIWGHSLCGPVVLVHPPTRAAIASAADPDGQFTQRGGGWFGMLPADLQTANTAVSWGGDRWTMVLLPLPSSEFDRVTLLAHEAFHRVQPELGLSARDAQNPHLDDEQGRLWLRLELRASSAALGASTEDDALEAVRDALAFRAHRHRLFPDADSLESLLERHEGLAEYTGVVYASRVLGGGAARVVEALAAFEDRYSQIPIAADRAVLVSNPDTVLGSTAPQSRLISVRSVVRVHPSHGKTEAPLGVMAPGGASSIGGTTSRLCRQ